jgi:hypothetical protein
VKKMATLEKVGAGRDYGRGTGMAGLGIFGGGASIMKKLALGAMIVMGEGRA